MPNPNNVWVVGDPKGWKVKREGLNEAVSYHRTQAEAWEAGKDLARELKGEAFLQGLNGKIRERNTYGHDPRGTKG